MNIENIIFVCQKGKLELEAKILAASLRSKWGYEFSIVAAVPHSIELLNVNTVHLLKSLKVNVLEIQNLTFHKYTTHYGTPYLHGNKIDACREFTVEGRNLLIDTDTYVIDKLPDLLINQNLEGCGARTISCDLFHEEKKDFLKQLFMEFKSDFEKISYYNSGVIFYHSSSNFQRLWGDITHKIINDERIVSEDKFPWADQISFSIIASLPEITFNELPSKEFNSFDPGWRRVDIPTYIHHYHNIWRNFQQRKSFEYLVALEEFVKEEGIEAKIFHEMPLWNSFNTIHKPNRVKIRDLQNKLSSLT